MRRAKADSAKADAQLEYCKQIEGLQAIKHTAGKKLVEVKQAGDDAWEDLKACIYSTWDSFRSSVKSAVSRFRQYRGPPEVQCSATRYQETN